MPKRKACVISCGMIARSAHIPAYQRFPADYELTAVCDVDADLARKTSEAFGIPHWYADAETMLRAEQPEVVSVCAGNRMHRPLTELALRAGAHVICEKPLAVTLADARALFALAEAQGAVLMACQTLRFLPERLAVRRLVERGAFGELYHCEFSRVRPRGIPTWGQFHRKATNGGGSLLDVGVHALDSALWLCGNPRPLSVTAAMRTVHADEAGTAVQGGALTGETVERTFRPEEMDVESFASGCVTFENGMNLLFKAAWAANLPEENTIRLSGTGLGVDTERRELYAGGKTCPLEIEPNEFGDHPFFGHFYVIRHMARVLNGQEPRIILPAETENTAAVLEAAYRSAALGRPVLLDELTAEAL